MVRRWHGCRCSTCFGAFSAFQDASDAAARRETISASLAALDPALSDVLPHLLGLLGIQETPDPLGQMDPQIKRRRTFDAIKRVILRESVKQPVIIMFEDLHWIDSQTQAFLDLLAESIANARVLLLVNYRPEYRHESPTNRTTHNCGWMHWTSKAEMLATLLGESVELNQLKQKIINSTEGNPFFIEEMVRALFDEGALVRNGSVTITRSLSQVRIPLRCEAFSRPVSIVCPHPRRNYCKRWQC
jgi:predicted ATPase